MKNLIKLIVSFPIAIPTMLAQNNPPIKSFDEGVMLESIAVVENSAGKIGNRGEVSPWQIMPETWEQYSTVEFEDADPKQQAVVALRILRSYAFILTQRHIPVTVTNVALAWNAGPNRKIWPSQSLEYSNRVLNVYNRKIALKRAGGAK